MSVATSNVDNWNQLLLNKVVLLTGGAGHIARSIAKACYAHGAYLVLGDLDPILINKVKDEIIEKEAKEDRILVVKLDVTDEKSIEHAVQTTLDKWKTIHVLLNTAAIFPHGNLEEVSLEDWSRAFDVNVRGYALMVKHIAAIMKKQNSGSIVNMASSLGLIAVPNLIPYSTTKAAIIQMTRNLALDLGLFNIRVNSISPGLVDLPSIDEHAKNAGVTGEQLKNSCTSTSCIKRLVQAQELANLVIFLSSDLCQFMTGANVVVDGGHSII